MTAPTALTLAARKAELGPHEPSPFGIMTVSVGIALLAMPPM